MWMYIFRNHPLKQCVKHTIDIEINYNLAKQVLLCIFCLWHAPQWLYQFTIIQTYLYVLDSCLCVVLADICKFHSSSSVSQCESNERMKVFELEQLWQWNSLYCDELMTTKWLTLWRDWKAFWHTFDGLLFLFFKWDHIWY